MLITWSVFIIEGLFTNLFLQELNISVLPFIVIFITSLFLFMDLSRAKLPKYIFLFILFSYFVRLFLMFFDLYGREIFILPNSGKDSEMYHATAINGLITGDYLNGGLYSRIIAMIYSLFGEERILSQFFNVLFSMNTILLTYKLMGFMNIKIKIKNMAIAIMAFMPNYAIMSSILLKESLIIFLNVLSIYYFLKWINRDNKKSLIISYLIVLFSSALHSGAIALFITYSVFLIIYDKRKNKVRITKKSFIYVAFFTIIFVFLYGNYGSILFGKFTDVESLGDIAGVAESRVSGGAAYSIGLHSGNALIDLIINFPIRSFYFILSPLPWEWRGLNDVIAFLFSAVFYGYSYYCAFKTLKYKNINNKLYFILLLLVMVMSTLIFSWGVSNAGTALRHRDKFITIFILMLALARNNSSSKVKIKEINNELVETNK